MAQELIKEIQNGIWKWYPFVEGAKVLFVEDPSCIKAQENTYDYIVAVLSLEKANDPHDFLKKCRKVLKEDGKLLLAMDNRYGIRYFCGDRDPYTGRSFDGIENYRSVSPLDGEKQTGRLFDKATVESWLQEVGFVNRSCLSVFPSIEAPQLFYAQDYLPEEELSIRYMPYYNYPDTVFLEESFLLDGLMKNNMFHQMANGYFIECALGSGKCKVENIKHITLSMDRGKEFALATIIYRNNIVEKRAMYPEGVDELHRLRDNHDYLKSHGINVIEGTLEKNSYVMPYIKAENGTRYLQSLLRTDTEMFIKEMDRFRQIILDSSEHVEPVLSEYENREYGQIAKGVWLKNGFFDLVPLNAFYVDGDYLFFDQEFCIENCPANAIVVRMVDIVYGSFSDLEAIIPRDFFWKRYKMEDQVSYLRKIGWDFLSKLRNQKQLRVFNEMHGINMGEIHSNRQRINFSVGEYQKLFINIFEDIEQYKVILFGTGKFARRFIELYGSVADIECAVDNNQNRWGQEVNAIPIFRPSELKKKDKNNYKIIICIKNYLGVLQQVRALGFENIGIFDPNMVYPIQKQKQAIAIKEKKSDAPKPYKVGYIAGVFDLYHIGHLNMFRRAKEQCEYLIVGVVTDEGVRKKKGTVPFIPFEERIEMVRSCKYVDEAVEIPFEFSGTRDAYRMYHFDVQFSGNDYENDGNWLAEREFLRKQGADMVFFPYTEQTSSTKIKALINKQLEEK